MIKENGIILEDDVIFNENIIERIEKMEFMKNELIYIGGLLDEYKIIYDGYSIKKRIMGMYGYIINEKKKDRIIEILEKKKYPIDIAMIKKFNKNRNILYMDIIKTEIDNKTNTGGKSEEFHNMFNKNINIIE